MSDGFAIFNYACASVIVVGILVLLFMSFYCWLENKVTEAINLLIGVAVSIAAILAVVLIYYQFGETGLYILSPIALIGGYFSVKNMFDPC
ncbi:MULTISPECIES: hypothetical protein [Cysteiniphilum]|uniref:Uncharacterized protein n=1 Tax=Cysteiniphilum litorale TaxID=2056700 RepID=A0A8J2Z2N4_9GAMM|nr:MULTISPECIES: hypothetical protein [Cysteiniphilum]GGF91612.1 hypothetical protein GCM10010995_06040 [Cysteiniphilum litorale]